MPATHSSFSRIASLLLCFCLLSAPVAALSPKGQKNYKQGLDHEAAQQWEKAAEEFALAVSADPSNIEYQLHYRRSVFNASQVFMQQGATLYERHDYLAAYNAFRRAYGYDQSNELAHSMMERALRLQLKDNPVVDDANVTRKASPETKIAPAAYQQEPLNAPPSNVGEESAIASARSEQLRVITYSGDLENFIKYLARQIRLNVVFDRDFPKRNVNVDLQEVSSAQALDYIFLTQGLFFQKLTAHTILVADQTKRPQYQQLVLRTFYLYNVEPNDARLLIQAALPPQAGRQPVITPNKSTNSITVRDTPENVRLVGEILKSIDKERAEVVMDVNIYEVSRNDLMQFGNQLGTDATLQNLGGIQKGLNILGGSRETLLQGAAALAGPTALGAALIIPSSTLSALQRKDNTRLIASTQVHAFDGEKSTAHIGQRVPVQTASVTSFGSVNTGDSNNNTQPGVTPGLFGGSGYPVIQYEKTGLTLEFTPQVFPDLDVQVKMSIKSNDVANAGGTTLTPTFTERDIEGTARIQNNRTMMIASVAQNQQSHGRQGLPILGLVPIFGRLFSAPRRNDSQTDIVIAVTPHVMRAPVVTPRDEEVHPSGTLQNPNSDTLEAMLQEITRDEQLASARLIPKVSNVQIADAEIPEYVPAPKALMKGVSVSTNNIPQVENALLVSNVSNTSATPVDNSKVVASEPSSTPADINPTPAIRARYTQPVTGLAPSPERVPVADAKSLPRSAAELRLLADAQEMRVGEKRQIKLLLKTDAPLDLIALSLHFDPQVLAVRSITQGNLIAGLYGATTLRQMVTPEGLALVSVASAPGAASISGAGVLLIIEAEALSEGSGAISFGTDDAHLKATDGRQVSLRATAGGFIVK